VQRRAAVCGGPKDGFLQATVGSSTRNFVRHPEAANRHEYDHESPVRSAGSSTALPVENHLSRSVMIRFQCQRTWFVSSVSTLLTCRAKIVHDPTMTSSRAARDSRTLSLLESLRKPRPVPGSLSLLRTRLTAITSAWFP